MKQEDCIFDKIHLIKQKIPKHAIPSLLEIMYNNICFSTFPYLVYKQDTSQSSIRNYNSGNCIGFAYFVKMYLEKNFKIKSYIIGASVPSIFKVEGTPHICHCAVVIPIDLYQFYIIDGALYFLEPMFCDLRDNQLRYIYNSNCHNHERTKIMYQIQTCETNVLDNQFNQILPEMSLCVQATFVDLPNETWNYYLSEIKNPDNNIGLSFLRLKNDPFLMYTKLEDNIVKMKYKIDFDTINNVLIIKEYPQRNIIYKGNTYDKDKTLQKVFQELRHFFDDFII